jgi:hypothetical protein
MVDMGEKSKGGREARKPKANAKPKGQTPSPVTSAINPAAKKPS